VGSELIDGFDLDGAAEDGPDGAGERGRKNGEPRDVVVRRLPIYARTLEYLAQEGVTHVSSNELGERIGISAAQIRRDLAYFGDFGKQGKGYHVAFLLGQIKDILRLQSDWNMAIVGMGDLGRALVHYEGFAQGGFCVRALFDHNRQKVGQQVGNLTIHHIDDLPRMVADAAIRVAVLAVPPRAAQEVADRLIAAGVRAILNYAPTVVKVPGHVRIRHIDPVVALQSMTYYLEPEDA
jgi:redox-sensing transcriptional repressor